MSANFEYAKKKAEKQKKNRNKKKWYILEIGDYSVYFWALPIAIPIMLLEKFQEWNYLRQEWSDEKATKALNKILPKVLEYVADENGYFYCLQWGEDRLWHSAPIGYKTWAKKYRWDLHKFIRDGYENPNYIKTVDDSDPYYEVWVKFEPKNP